MWSLVSLLVTAAKPYTNTHMVAEAVSNPSGRKECGLFKLAAIEGAPMKSNDTTHDSDKNVHDNHCDNSMHGDLNHVATIAPMKAPYTKTRTQQRRAESSGATADAAHDKDNKRQPHQVPAKATKRKCLRVRGSGMQDEADAIIALSQCGGKAAIRLIRKVLVMLYNEGGTLSDMLSTHSLINIDATITDSEVEDEPWEEYGVQLTWLDEETNDGNNEDDDYYYNNANNDEDDYFDAREDTNDWQEGDAHIGIITSWNDNRNYGVIFVMDDYTEGGNTNPSAQLFCHGSNFTDGSDCTIDVLDEVLFTVKWDYERERWHAVDVAARTDAAYYACIEKLQLSEKAEDHWQFMVTFAQA